MEVISLQCITEHRTASLLKHHQTVLYFLSGSLLCFTIISMHLRETPSGILPSEPGADLGSFSFTPITHSIPQISILFDLQKHLLFNKHLQPGPLARTVHTLIYTSFPQVQNKGCVSSTEPYSHFGLCLATPAKGSSDMSIQHLKSSAHFPVL